MGIWNGTADAGIVGDSLSSWEGISPELILVIFLPALIFGSALSVDYHVFAREIGQMLILAVPGVVISAVLTSTFAVYAFPYEWGWNEGLAFGAMLSATDPVAVVSRKTSACSSSSNHVHCALVFTHTLFLPALLHRSHCSRSWELPSA